MPLSPLTKQARRDEHAKNEKADIIYRIITNKKKSPSKPSKPSKSSSSRSPSNTLLPSVSLWDLPDDIIRKITLTKYKSLLTSYKLREWIPIGKIAKQVSLNPNALDFLSLPENKNYINYSQLAENTNSKAIELLRAKLATNIKPNLKADIIYGLSKNPNAMDLIILEEYFNYISWEQLSSNTSPFAIELLEIMPENINWYNLSSNPAPEAIALLRKNIKNIDWDALTVNKSAAAIELLREHKNHIKIKMHLLSANPFAVDFLIANIDDIGAADWDELSGNPSALAVKLLKVNKEKIGWSTLSSNPFANALLTKRVKYENTLSKDEYEELEDAIDWENLSGNPNAIALIRQRLEKESKMSLAHYRGLMDSEKISWENLSGNPNAIELLRDCVIYKGKMSANSTSKITYKIDWKALAGNPSIFAIT
jgi:hypothetical protein